jgi:ketosteroid isomerase-like protein
VSPGNLELVAGLQPAPDDDLVRLLAEEKTWLALAPRFHVDVVSVMHAPGLATPTVGVDALRATWSEWLAPWRTYRSAVDRTIDLGERVVVLVREFARRESTGPEVPFNGAAVWTVHDGKIARVEFYPDRAEALRAVDLEE